MNIGKRFHSALTCYYEGQFDEAITICSDILLMHPDYPDAMHLLAILYYQRKEYTLAVKHIENVFQRDPDDFSAYFLMGTVYQAQGDLKKAASFFEKCTEMNPSFADAYYNLAIILEKTDQDEKALTSYKRALALNPNLADVYNNLGNLLLKMKHFDEAVTYLGKALELNPDYILACNNMGIALKAQGHFEEAVHYFHKSIELNPSFADAYCNLALILKEKDNLDEAARHLEKVIELNPTFAEAYCNLAIIFEESGRIDEALSYYQKALQITPDDAEVHWNLSHALLSTGNFKEGWRKYEWRFKVKDFKQRTLLIPQWDGSSLKGKKLLIHAEQGIGEEIMFASCLPEVIAQADLCVIGSDKRLVPLFARSFPKAKVIRHFHSLDDLPNDIPPLDRKAAIGSLPLFLRSDIGSFPHYKAYLIPDSLKVESWRNRFAALGTGLTIGISWRGGSKPGAKLARSTVLKQWATLFSVPGIHFINLQYGDCAEELKKAAVTLGVTIHDWDDADPLRDLDSFAAQVAALDLVISVDNATVHMAGALGVPVWTLLPFACDWRWMREYEDTPWYKTVRLFRQSSHGDWETVFARVTANLKQYIANGAMPEISPAHSYKSTEEAPILGDKVVKIG